MKLKIYQGSDISCNSYLLIKNQEVVIFDPLLNPKKLISYIEDNNLTIKAIILTHGHYDHIKGTKELYDSFKCPIYIHFDDEELLYDYKKNCSWYFKTNFIFDFNVLTFENELSIDGFDIEVIPTPFHTLGSTCFYIKELQILISGDTLFKRGVGRYDLYGGNSRLMVPSLRKLIDLYKRVGDIKVYPGHGPITSLKEEITFNHHFKD